MGNDPKKPAPKKVDLDDAIIQMKIQSKGVMRAAKKAEKQSDKYMKQAKDALKKNNQDFAKLYLTSASQKKSEAINYQRTAIKMQLMCDRVKSMKNNENIVQTFGQMTQAVNQQMSQIDQAKMFEQMQVFNDKMDQMMINNKMTNEIMAGNDVVDTTANDMMDVLKQQLAMQQKNALYVPEKQQFNYNTNKNQKQSQYSLNTSNQTSGQQSMPSQSKKQESSSDPFLDQLKGL